MELYLSEVEAGLCRNLRVLLPVPTMQSKAELKLVAHIISITQQIMITKLLRFRKN